MTTEKPLALKLADELENPRRWHELSDSDCDHAAAELRRLHAENEALKQALTPGDVVPVEKQIAEALRTHGLTLVKKSTGYAVLKLGTVQAQSTAPQPQPKHKGEA